MGTPQGVPRRDNRAIAIAGYLLLFVFGAVQGVVGSFQYSSSPAPLVAVVLVAVIFATCLLCGWGMRTFAGGLAPAVGWFIASFVLSMTNSQGSIIITATTEGEVYLYGGTLAATAGVAIAFVLWARRQRGPRRR